MEHLPKLQGLGLKKLMHAFIFCFRWNAARGLAVHFEDITRSRAITLLALRQRLQPPEIAIEAIPTETATLLPPQRLLYGRIRQGFSNPTKTIVCSLASSNRARHRETSPSQLLFSSAPLVRGFSTKQAICSPLYLSSERRTLR